MLLEEKAAGIAGAGPGRTAVGWLAGQPRTALAHHRREGTLVEFGAETGTLTLEVLFLDSRGGGR